MSATDQIRDRLRAPPLPGEADAAARSWPVVEAALAERGPARRRAVASPGRPSGSRSWPPCSPRASPSASPAGAAVGNWIGDRFTAHDARSAPAFAALPPGGSVLAISHSGAYSIRPDGGARRLGGFLSAGWSPHRLHVVGAAGRSSWPWTRREP